MRSYTKLTDHFKKVSHFNHLAAICGWDQAAMMPSGGAQARSEAMAELSVHIHQLKTQPQLQEWFTNAENETLPQEESASLREMKRQWQQSNILPEKLVQAKSLAGSRCENAWRTQRKENDWTGFAKNWQEVVKLSQEEAQIRAEIARLTPYDAMLDVYEPGTTTQSLDLLFSDVKHWLPDLINQVIDKQSTEDLIIPQGPFPVSKQKDLGLELMKLLQFDFNRGRLDESVHPFCGGVPQDVRLTTRYNNNEFVQALMGIIHETGHARYEQGLPSQYLALPVGEARSMGIHESQSLFMEMQLGRNEAFIERLCGLSVDRFSKGIDKAFTKDNFQKLYTRVEKGFIRVDADELTYPAHIILRYEIERDLINGKITYTDVPELWSEKMKAYLGLTTKDNYKDGCMQDIHWTDGAFGYFPSYTLGAMYAAQFMASMKQSVDVDAVIRSGELSPIFNWLSENIWSMGSLLTTDELVKAATGEVLNPKYFKAHLENRYL